MELSVLLGRFGSRNISRIVSELCSVWTSVAFTLAAAAACVGLLRRLKILAVGRRSRMYNKRGISSSSSSYSPDHAGPLWPSSVDSPDADDVDDSSWCSSDDSDEEKSDSDSEGDDQGQDGELAVGRSAVWTREEVGWGGGVVKTWEGIGLGLGSDRTAGKREPLSSLSCGGGEFSTAAVRVWKAMAASQGPAAEAAAAGHYIPWPALPGSSSRRASVGRGGWRSAWEETLRSDAGAGRDAEEEEEIRDPPYAGRGRSGSSVVVTWCRNAASRLPLLPSPNAARNGTRPGLPP